jgi:uncharacterized membrane protein
MNPPDPRRREEAGVPPALRGLVSRLLISGLAVAGLCFLIGVVAYLHQGIGLGGSSTASGLPSSWPTALVHGDPGAFVFLGLVVLVATPMTRIIVSAGLFAAAGDRPFTMLTLFVFTVLVVTILVGALR